MSVLIAGLILGWLLVLIFAWALCRAAALGDREGER